LYTAVYWLGDRYILIQVRKLFPELKHYKTRVFVALLLVVVYTLSVTEIGEMIVSSLQSSSFSYNFKTDRFYRQNITSLMVTVSLSSIYEVVYFVYLYKSQLLESERLKKEFLRAQLQELKNQIDPHFLFNSLNTLVSIIPEDPKLSVQFVQYLSKVYRYILELKDNSFITLQEELECIRSYQFLIEIRFGNSVSIETHIPKEAEKKFIVPLSAQMLLENAVKHNVANKQHQLRISISVKDDFLVVSNNVNLKQLNAPSTKTGLENIKRRYGMLTNKPVIIEENKTNFKVSLPLLQIDSL
jgi:LytS/YehU family sensor histidine kinase